MLDSHPTPARRSGPGTSGYSKRRKIAGIAVLAVSAALLFSAGGGKQYDASFFVGSPSAGACSPVVSVESFPCGQRGAGETAQGGYRPESTGGTEKAGKPEASPAGGRNYADAYGQHVAIAAASRGVPSGRGLGDGPVEMEIVATGYSASREEGTEDGVTATGTRVRRGVAAVDPRVIPLGSEMYVPGYGWARAEDTGGAIKGRRVDLFFPSREEALRWGVKKVKVVIERFGKN
ncbi:hypothetical protein E308F_17820 [Moorella sp. E308F]|uniref:3D domain-containing protein n=1 Tax=unclassified Neomoorella TaxID=2676739 RepID=UPI0010FFC37D|nr:MULTISPECIES: 3D domain-containing protein [unclassified Moorella (in: firmicutes)]GEA15538.1 hypothetical protein E308F_17820 [Moorella sp. E308F]GEA19604.1 hypothetical protein E306M_27420 [Moorella sp. E306M]